MAGRLSPSVFLFRFRPGWLHVHWLWVCASLAVCVCGCSSEPDLTGSWVVQQAELEDPGGTVPVALKNMVRQGMPGTCYTFGADGQYRKVFAHEASVNQAGTWERTGARLSLTDTAGNGETWRITGMEGDQLRATVVGDEAEVGAAHARMNLVLNRQPE
ncbi:MAG: hypothetical protein ACK5QE_01360 [Sphingobacteriia bacterium]